MIGTARIKGQMWARSISRVKLGFERQFVRRCWHPYSFPEWFHRRGFSMTRQHIGCAGRIRAWILLRPSIKWIKEHFRDWDHVINVK